LTVGRVSCCPLPYIYTLSLHDALPIWLHHRRVRRCRRGLVGHVARRGANGTTQDELAVLDDLLRDPADLGREPQVGGRVGGVIGDRKSTRLNSSHVKNSYAVFCLNKKI